MVSNAFCRSINIAIVEHSASRDDTIFSVIWTRAVRVDLLCLKPYWLLFKNKFFSRKPDSLLSNNFYIILENWDNNEIGL